MGTLSNKYPNAQAVENALNKGVDAYDNMGQIELVYNGTDIRFNNEVVNFQQIVDYITTDARFCYMVYNNRVLLTSDMQLTGGTRYVFFETSTTDSGLSKNTVVKVYSADGTTISSISHSTIANENFNNKVSTIAPNDKNSTVHYPNNKAVTEITDEIKEDLTELSEIHKSSNYYTGIYEDGKSLNSNNTTSDNASRGTTDYLAIDAGETYYIHFGASQGLTNFVRVITFDSSHNKVDEFINETTFTTASNVAFYRLCAHHDYLNDRFMVSKNNATGTDTYEEYFEPYVSVKPTMEIINSRTNVNGKTFTEFGDRISDIEYGNNETKPLKYRAMWEVGDISSNSSNYGKIVASSNRCVNSDVLSFNEDVTISTDFTVYRIYMWTYADKDERNPVGIGWITSDRTIPKGTFFRLVLARVTPINISTAYEEMLFSLSIKAENMVKDWNTTVKGINHRGYSVGVPEESELAYITSAKKGFLYTETDVHFTSDGIPVCCHNEIVISDGTHINPTRYTIVGEYTQQVNVESSTYAELNAYDWGYYAGSQYLDTKILKFEDFLKICRNTGMRPYIEVKSSATYDSGEIEMLVSMVKTYGLEKWATWIGGSIDYLERVKNANPKARLGYVIGTPTQALIDAIMTLKTDENEVFINASYTGINESTVLMCIDNHCPLEAWVADGDEADIIKNLNPYVTGITSNSMIAGKILFEQYQ